MDRLNQINAQFGPADAANKLTKNSLSVTDNRTGKFYRPEIEPQLILKQGLKDIQDTLYEIGSFFPLD